MEFSWTTFLLEIINFLILVWILKKFLYRPVMDMLEQRRKNIEQTLQDATEQHNQASQLEQEYQQRLDNWEKEKQQAYESLQLDIKQEREKLYQQLLKEIDNEKEKADAISARQQARTLKQQQQNAHLQASRFAAKLLNSVAGPEVESRLIKIAINELQRLDDEQKNRFRDSCKNNSQTIDIISAYSLSQETQQQLEQLITTICKQPVSVTCSQDPQLIAGLRITIGDLVLRLNLQDELDGFVELGHDYPAA